MSKKEYMSMQKEVNLKSKDIIDELKKNGVEVSNHMQALEENDIKTLNKAFKNKRQLSQKQLKKNKQVLTQIQIQINQTIINQIKTTRTIKITTSQKIKNNKRKIKRIINKVTNNSLKKLYKKHLH